MTGDLLVTGAGGNVGGAVVDAAVGLGLPVRAGDRSRSPALPDGVDWIELDFTDPRTFRPALRGVGSVFLIRPPAISRVGPTLNAFVDASVAAGVEHIVFSSVAGADTNVVVPHHRVERHLRRADVGWTILRPGFFAQNLATAYREDIVTDDRIVVPAADGQVAFVDTRDIGGVAAVVLGDPVPHRGRAHHLTGPEALDFHDVADLLTEVLGRPITYEPASVLGYLRHLHQQGLPLPLVVVQTLLHVGLRRGDGAPVTSTVSDLLGRPARSLRDYVTDNAAAFARPGSAAA